MNNKYFPSNSPFSKSAKLMSIADSLHCSLSSYKESDIAAMITPLAAHVETYARATGMGFDELLEQTISGVNKGFDGEIYFQFAGQFAKTANLSNRSKAILMMEDNASEFDIWQQTGWVMGSEGMWRFEIDDSKAVIRHPYPEVVELYSQVNQRPKEGDTYQGEVYDKLEALLEDCNPDYFDREFKLEDILSHEALYDAYPFLRAFRVKFDKDDPYECSIRGDKITLGRRQLISAFQAKRSLMHEIQHAIQDFEDLCRGGSPGKIKDVIFRQIMLLEAKDELRNKLIHIGTYCKAIATNKELINSLKSNPAAVENTTMFVANKPDTLPKEHEARLAALRQVAQSVIDKLEKENTVLESDLKLDRKLPDDANKLQKEADHALSEANKYIVQENEIPDLQDTFLNNKAHDLYMLLGGEVEARNTALRSELTHQERQALLPKTTEDRPRNGQIVMHNDNVMVACGDKRTYCPDFAGFAINKLVNKEAAVRTLDPRDIMFYDSQFTFEEIGKAYALNKLSIEEKEFNLRILSRMQEYEVTEMPKGATVVGKDGSKYIHLFDRADAGSVAHELGHVFLENMRKFAEVPNAPQWMQDDWNTTREWLGLNPGEVPSIESHEKFAMGFERYLADGKDLPDGMGRVFDRFKKWCATVIRALTCPEHKPSKEMRQVYKRMISGPENNNSLAPS